jgi:hypothetical protein
MGSDIKTGLNKFHQVMVKYSYIILSNALDYGAKERSKIASCMTLEERNEWVKISEQFNYQSSDFRYNNFIRYFELYDPIHKFSTK